MFETLGFDLCFYVSLLGELSGEREERLHLTQALSLHALNWVIRFYVLGFCNIKFSSLSHGGEKNLLPLSRTENVMWLSSFGCEIDFCFGRF